MCWISIRKRFLCRRAINGEGPPSRACLAKSASVAQTAVRFSHGRYADLTYMLHAIRFMVSDNLVSRQ